MGDMVELEAEQRFDAALTKLWHRVVEAVNKLLEAHGKFGFHKIEANLNPSIEDITHGLAIFDSILNTVMDSALLNHDQMRTALNSKQCILHVRRLAEAVKSKDQQQYDEIIRLLDSQAKL